MLERMADLVRADGGRRDRAALVHVRRQVHLAVFGVVVVGKLAFGESSIGTSWRELSSRTRRATSAPVKPWDAGTWRLRANVLFTRCWTQKPMTIGTMKAMRKVMRLIVPSCSASLELCAGELGGFLTPASPRSPVAKYPEARAPVAQWIEQRFPKPRAHVRFMPGALSRSRPAERYAARGSRH